MVKKMSARNHELLQEISTTDELLLLVNNQEFKMEIQKIERFSGETILCLGDDSDDGTLWHIFLKEYWFRFTAENENNIFEPQ